MKSETIVIYEPNHRHKIGFFRTWLVMIKNIIASKELIAQLFKRDFLATYKKSILGIGWILIYPAIGIISWIFMNAIGILNPGDVGIPYPAYVLLSSSIWGLFMGFYGSASDTLGAGGGFIMQVNYPHEALLIKQTAHHLANFILGFAMNIIVLIFFGVMPDWKIVFFPILILPLFLLGAGIGLVMSVVNIVSAEIKRVIDILLGLVFYITPIIYSSNHDNAVLQDIMKWNPLTYLVGGVRDMIIYGRMDHFDRYIYATILTFVVFMFSWRLFYVSEDKVIERMI